MIALEICTSTRHFTRGGKPKGFGLPPLTRLQTLSRWQSPKKSLSLSLNHRNSYGRRQKKRVSAHRISDPKQANEETPQ
jgi:hypothetical protein